MVPATLTQQKGAKLELNSHVLHRIENSLSMVHTKVDIVDLNQVTDLLLTGQIL